MSKILITGGDGYLGVRVAKNLLAKGESVILSMRDANREDKISKIKNSLGPDINLANIDFHFGSLESSDPYGDLSQSHIDRILHTAAVIRFSVEEELANKVNIEGTEKILKFADSCSDLKQMNYLSTVYASGAITGSIAEAPFPTDLEFTNHYERSKNYAENLMLEKYAHLPWNILRVATVICEDETGVVNQYNAVHNTLRLLYNGLISLVPGQEDTPLYFVTAQFVSETIGSILVSDEKNSIFNICHTREESAVLGELLDLVFKVFETDEDFKKKRILRPLLVDNTSFTTLSDSLKLMSSGIVGDALGSITPFAGQLYRVKEFDNRNTQRVHVDYKAPNINSIIESCAKYLVASKWGRKDV